MITVTKTAWNKFKKNQSKGKIPSNARLRVSSPGKT